MEMHNEYSWRYPEYDDTPKNVIAAIAWSLAMLLDAGDETEVVNRLRAEWSALYLSRIVSKRPILRDAAR